MNTLNMEIKKALEIQNLSITQMEMIEDICIQVFDDEGHILAYSKGCEMIEGMKKESVIGRTIDEVYTIEKSEANPYGSIPLTVLKTGKVMKNNHVKFTPSNGKKVEVISSTYPVFSDNQSTIIGAICVFRDIGDYILMADTIQKLQNDLAAAKASSRNNGTIYSFSDIIGSSHSLQECINLARRASKNMAPVMITGATGTGKEVLAQSIHNESSHGFGRFVAINCSAIPENLLESILFGTCKGAYTGATETKGLFETAEGGTLFLDEINSMSMALQSKLLRALETKMIRKVGGNVEIPINVRVISATNQDPLQAIREKKIRADLYYRLAGLVLIIPELKHRKEDIPVLSNHFIRQHSQNLGKNITAISQEAYQILLEHDWPGNVRELKHTIDQAIYYADQGEAIIGPEHLPKYILDDYSKKSSHSKYLRHVSDSNSLKETLSRIERDIILETYQSCNGNISETARQMGITRQNLQHKLRAYEIKGSD